MSEPATTVTTVTTSTGRELTLTEIASGTGFGEGPVVTPAGELYISSIDHARVYRIADGTASVVAELGGGANGLALAADGTLYVAQNGGRWAAEGPSWAPSSVGGIQRVTPDGAVEWVTQEQLSPNDLCFGPDGMLYVTDPTRAPRGGIRPVDGRIWRTDPASGATELLLSVPWFTNGIAFGPDDRLYVAATHTSAIYRYDVTPHGLENEELVIRMQRGGPDGMAFDANGDLVICAVSLDDGPGTIQSWSTDGRLLELLEPGDGPLYTNVAFTAAGELVITDSAHGRVLLASPWPVGGLPLHPFR